MRHVIVINQFALPRTEGGGTRHADLFSRVQGWRTTILAGNRNHYTQDRFRTRDPYFRLVRVPRQSGGAVARLLGWVAFSLQACVVALRSPADLVYGSSPQPFAALAGLVAARLRRIPFVLEVRDLWPESVISAGRLAGGGLTYRFFAALERLLVTRAERIVCVTDGWEDHFARLGVPADRLVVVPNGTDPDDFKVPQTRDQLREEQGIEGFTAVFAGAHGPKDGIDLVVDAARQLPEIRFVLVGSGVGKAAAQARVRTEGISNVQFRDPVPKDQLPRLLRACDVGLHAVSPLTVFEKGMSPNKLFDYMAAGLPVVSNAAVALDRVVRDHECGRIGTSLELASCLRAVSEASPEQRAAWSEQSVRTVAGRFSRAAAAAELAATLDAVVTGRRAERLS